MSTNEDGVFGIASCSFVKHCSLLDATRIACVFYQERRGFTGFHRKNAPLSSLRERGPYAQNHVTLRRKFAPSVGYMRPCH